MQFSILRAIGLASALSSLSIAAPWMPQETNSAGKRETPCIALNDCPPHGSAPPSSSSTSPPPKTSPAPTSTPPPPLPSTPVAPQSAIAPYLYSCNDTQSSMISEAWAEASQLAVAGYDWSPPGFIFNGAYQDAMDLYMGTDSRNDYNYIAGTGQLLSNVKRQYQIHTGNAAGLTFGYFYCNEADLPGDKQRQKPQCGVNTTAYTFDDLGVFWSAHYVVFCPTFWSGRMSSLAQKVSQAKYNTNLPKVMDPWRPIRARSLFHETYHWAQTVSKPKCDLQPEKYKPSAVTSLAAAQNTGTARLNAESWAQSAMAIFLQQTFGLDSPPVPRDALPSVANDSDVSSLSDDGDALEELALDGFPDGFVPPVANSSKTFDPDMANVTMLNLSPAELTNATSNATTNLTKKSDS